MRRNPKMLRLVGSIGLSVLVGACVTFTRPGGGKADRGRTFKHPGHIEEELECDMCHEFEDGAASIPGHDVCEACHDFNVDEPSPDDCGVCHSSEDYVVEPRAAVLPEEVLFSHDPHVEKEIECAVCHPDPDAMPLMTKGPVMPVCMKCHGETDAKLVECAVCHTEISKDTRPTYRGTARIPHDAPDIWEHVHGSESKVDPAFCTMCHELESVCDDCHQKNPPKDHNVSFRRRTHGLEASWDRRKCSTCHEEDSCMQCHRNTKPRTHRRAWGEPINRHCTTCHYPPKKTNCIVCHESIDHHKAGRSPHNYGVFPALCGRCHPGGLAGRPPHPTNSSTRCNFCH